MIKKYYSKYTGKQIDEAVAALIENNVRIEDLSPELVAEIKRWIATGEGTKGTRELNFKNHYEFPSVGDPLLLYIATDEDMIYYWSEKELCYNVIKSPAPESINGGGAQD